MSISEISTKERTVVPVFYSDGPRARYCWSFVTIYDRKPGTSESGSSEECPGDQCEAIGTMHDHEKVGGDVVTELDGPAETPLKRPVQGLHM